MLSFGLAVVVAVAVALARHGRAWLVPAPPVRPAPPVPPGPAETDLERRRLRRLLAEHARDLAPGRVVLPRRLVGRSERGGER